MRYSLRKISILSTQAILSASFLLLAACGTQKKAAETTASETSTTQSKGTSLNNVKNDKVQPIETRKFSSMPQKNQP